MPGALTRAITADGYEAVHRRAAGIAPWRMRRWTERFLAERVPARPIPTPRG